MELYKLLFEGRSQDAQRFWTVFNLMSLINGALLAIIASQDPPQLMKIIASLIGIFLCCIWYKVQRRLHGWIVWWEEKLTEYEPFCLEEINEERKKKKLLPLPNTIVVFQQRKDAVTTGMSTRKAGWYLPLGFILAWLFILLMSTNIGAALLFSVLKP